MSQTVTQQIKTEQQQNTLKIMRYNRFLLIRYVCAFLFFINLYASLFYIVSQSYLFSIPLVLILAQLPAVWEQIKLYSTPTSHIIFTKVFFILQVAMLIGVCLTCMTPLFSLAFPFLTVTLSSRLIIAISSLCLVGICLAMLVKLKKISLSKDRQYKRIQQYEHSLQY
ncbi:MAG: hypothetical protein L0I48_01070 [Lactococcus plantarum]|nr:hypothetical protein [Lactococcus plantarum]MDN6069761.1 hypothetical protein [Lactococcus plantarum]MDN6085471.1 hypothetical protein [Lactococcus plantarum]